MDGRQPFYHRNTDADEITYHAWGARTVLTELGCVDMKVGDMARIPVGVAHDNRATGDVHIIFYIPQGCARGGCSIPKQRVSHASVSWMGRKE